MTRIPAGSQAAFVPNTAFAITPSDSVNFTHAASVYVGGAGNVALVGMNDQAVVFSGVAAGSIIPGNWIRVNATSTTATLMVGLY